MTMDTYPQAQRLVLEGFARGLEAESPRQLVTPAEYARSRRARGLSGGTKEAVRKAINSRRISVVGQSKHVDPALADFQWERNTRPRARRAGGDVSTNPGEMIAALARVHQLGRLAVDALAGSTFAVVAPMLRQALEAVPAPGRRHVSLPLDVWDRLTLAEADAAPIAPWYCRPPA